MRIKGSFILIAFICQHSFVFGQKDEKNTLEFLPVFGNSILHLGDSFYKLTNGDSIQFETLKFYISGIELVKDDKLVWKEGNSFHLIDASVIQSLSILLNIKQTIFFNKIKFNIGIDSITNVSGALSGDLDPTRGMYWTWQSGYINFKLEGSSNQCKTRNSEFQFHLGGYLQPFSTLQNVILPVRKQKMQVVVMDIEKFISAIDLITENHIMSPGKEAAMLSEKLPGIFSFHDQ